MNIFLLYVSKTTTRTQKQGVSERDPLPVLPVRSTSLSMRTSHLPTCPSVSVEQWSVPTLVVEAQNLQAHLSRDCELAEVECEFSHAGCEVRVTRKLLPGHMTDNVVQHMSLLAQHTSQLATEN